MIAPAKPSFDFSTAEAPLKGSTVYLAVVCLVASLGGLLFGFDTAVISGTVERVKAQYDLTDLLQGWFASSALVGCILGAAMAGMAGDRFGRKPILIIASAFLFVSALYSAIPPTFTIIALLVIDRWGRRPLLIGGMAVVTVCLTLIGSLFLVGGADAALAGADSASGEISPVLGVWIVAVMCVYMACIALSICAVIWVLTPEIFPNRIRGRAVSIATLANWATNSVSALIFPKLVAAFGMHSGFFASAAVCLAATAFFWAMVPETKGKSLEEIEKHWLPD